MAIGSMATVERGQSWVWDGVQFDVLHPSASDYERKLKPNSLSCVLRVTAANASALLAGVIEAALEQDLLQSGQALQADWLLVPHHRSAS